MAKYGTIEGCTGQLEYLRASRSNEIGLILLHPHPLYGGSMHDSVLDTIDEAAAALDISTLRYNSRGVEGSDGEFDQGHGERKDLAKVIRAYESEVAQIHLCGYSFGASVVLQYAAESGFESNLILVAPPTSDKTPNLQATTHFIVGDNDHISSAALLAQWSKESSNMNLHVLDGADHFFAGYAGDVREIVKQILTGISTV